MYNPLNQFNAVSITYI